MKIVVAAIFMLSIVCIYGRRMPTQKDLDDELRKAFADEMPLDAPLAISKGEEGSLDASPFKQDACADITSTKICIIFTHHCQSTKGPGVYMRANCRQSCGLC